MLTPLDDSPWHQLPTTFDHAGTSDPRFFDRLWFAASDRRGGGALQFTLGVYQNMNVVDGGFVVVSGGRQHNVRTSRQLRPTYDLAAGPLRIEVVEPFRHIHLSVVPNPGSVWGELDWAAEVPPQEERHHFKRTWGRVVEDYSRYDQIGRLSGVLAIDGSETSLDSWWACRDHSWGVRERVGIPEPYTGEVARPAGSFFAFLFFSTSTHTGHVQATGLGGGEHFTAELRDLADGSAVLGSRLAVDATFVDDDRPRRVARATLTVAAEDGSTTVFDVEAQGPAVAMTGLGYGGYDDGAGLGVYRGTDHVEADVWDVSHPARVVYPDGRTDRPVHRIQPVHVVQRGPKGTSEGTGSLTFIAEADLDGDGHLRFAGGPVA